MLSHTSKAVRTAMQMAWNAVRVAVLGASSPDLRKG
jgi:hypothetical protein